MFFFSLPAVLKLLIKLKNVAIPAMTGNSEIDEGHSQKYVFIYVAVPCDSV